MSAIMTTEACSIVGIGTALSATYAASGCCSDKIAYTRRYGGRKRHSERRADCERTPLRRTNS